MPFSSRTGHLEPDTPVDYSKYFLPERFTPLFYTPFYHELTQPQRRRYNQLHGCYSNEQIMFFEKKVAHNVLRAILRGSVAAPLASSLRDFIKEEEFHTRMFRELNKLCSPVFYEKRDFYFVQLPTTMSLTLNWASRRPELFPSLIWIMLLEEERAVFMGREVLRSREELEPHFVAVQRVHLADEIGHVEWDEEILNLLWYGTAPLVRKVNAALLRWTIGEFFVVPKRSNMRVVEELVKEFPELRWHLPEMRRALLALQDNDDWNLSLYSRAIVPRTFAQLDRWPELHMLSRVLRGYIPREEESFASQGPPKVGVS